jgi:hypothetical protein
VENADHSLEMPNDRAENLAILDEVVAAIEDFAGPSAKIDRQPDVAGTAVARRPDELPDRE